MQIYRSSNEELANCLVERFHGRSLGGDDNKEESEDYL